MKTIHLTPEEAETKLCPFAKSFGDAATSASPKCQGPACMAWRLASPERRDLPVGMPPEGEGWVKAGLPFGEGGALTHRQEWTRQIRGYCGQVRHI